MFLLILDVDDIIYINEELFKFHYVSINSTTKNDVLNKFTTFKFHYVSINSERMILKILLVIIFKFHYVSINSLMVHLYNG